MEKLLQKAMNFVRIKTLMKGEKMNLGSPTHDKNLQVDFLKQRLNMFIDVLDAIDPEDADIEDIDRLISILDEMESKCKEFNNREIPESV